MAKDDEKKPRRPHRVPDSGQRVVLAGCEVPFGQLPDEFREQLERIKATAPKEGERRGPVTVWVRLDTVEADDKGEAVDKVAVDAKGEEVPGLYRAPTASSWRGGERRKPPAQIPLEREQID